MARSIWKGPFVELSLLKKAEAAQDKRRPRADQDLVAPFDDPAAVRRPHLQRLQRPQVRAGVGQRGHGRHEARRVRADPLLPGPRRPTRRASANGQASQPRRKVGDKEALAVGTTIRGSARKLNLVAGLIRGRKVEEALNILQFSPKAMADDVRKVLASAIANAENNHNLDVDALVVAEASVGKSISMKRFATRARGRSSRIVKPFSRIRVVVREQEEA